MNAVEQKAHIGSRITRENRVYKIHMYEVQLRMLRFMEKYDV